MSSGSSSPLDDDAFNCQVCFEPFKGRILQCKKGHGLCERCHDKLPSCPQCRSAFTGTRNFMMEDLLAKFQKLAQAKEGAASKTPKEPTTSNNVEEEQDPVAAEQQRRKKEKMKERKRKKKEALAASKAGPTEASSTSTSTTAEPAASVVVELTSPKIAKKKTKDETKVKQRKKSKSDEGGKTALVEETEVATKSPEYTDAEILETMKMCYKITPPIQPKGLFPCHQCLEIFIPACRILNHIRYFHKECFTQTTSSLIRGDCFVQETLRATFNMEIPLKNYRHAIHITDFGLFTLFVDVDRESKENKNGKNVVHSWVQIFGTRKMAKSFVYDIEMSAGNTKANFSDLCYHALVDETVVTSKNQCLTIPIANPNNCRKLQIKLSLSRNFDARSKKRSSETTLTSLQASNLPSGSQAQHKTGGAKKKGKKRNF